MPITRYSFSGQEEPQAGEVVLYEDHLAEVDRLEHIISGAEAEIHRQAEEIAKLKRYIEATKKTYALTYAQE